MNFLDYSLLADAWMKSSGDPDYNDICDLFDDDIINMADLAIFCDEWLMQF